MTDRNIRLTRDHLGLTTAELARVCGVSNRTAHRWLAGKATVSNAVWQQLHAYEVMAGHVRFVPGIAEIDEQTAE